MKRKSVYLVLIETGSTGIEHTDTILFENKKDAQKYIAEQEEELAEYIGEVPEEFQYEIRRLPLNRKFK